MDLTNDFATRPLGQSFKFVASDSQDISAHLELLTELKNDGVITEEEFQAKTQKLLEHSRQPEIPNFDRTSEVYATDSFFASYPSTDVSLSTKLRQLFLRLRSFPLKERSSDLRSKWKALRWEIRLSITGTALFLLLLSSALAIMGDQLYSLSGLALLMFLLPLPVVLTFYVSRPEPSAIWYERLGQWTSEKSNQAKQKQNFFGKWFSRPLWAAFEGSIKATDSIQDPHLRTGAAVALQVFIAFLAIGVLFLIVSIIAVLILLVIALLVIWLVMWLVSLANSEERTVTVPRRASFWNEGNSLTSGRSEVQSDLLGNEYVQHYDEARNKTGHSEERTAFLGDKYAQHFDENQNKQGWAEEQTSLLGDQ